MDRYSKSNSGQENLEKTARYARQVQDIVGTEPKPGDYWMTATVAEVLLIQKHYAEAARLYSAAVATAPAQLGSHKTTWKQASRLMEHLQPSAEKRAAVRRAFEHLPDAEA